MHVLVLAPHVGDSARQPENGLVVLLQCLLELVDRGLLGLTGPLELVLVPFQMLGKLFLVAVSQYSADRVFLLSDGTQFLLGDTQRRVQRLNLFGKAALCLPLLRDVRVGLLELGFDLPQLGQLTVLVAPSQLEEYG